MASFQKIEKPRTVQVTRLLVDEFVNMDALPRDRDLSERRLMVYRRILAAGEFRPVTWASCYCDEDDTVYRVNGKHTSTLLSQVDPLPKDFYVTIERYSCPNLEDVARLWSTFDSSTSARTGGDIVNSFASTVREFDGLPKKLFPLVVAAASHREWGIGYHNQAAMPERAELLLDNVDFALWLNGVIYPRDGDSNRAKHLIRTPVTSAMLKTYEKSKSASDEFWKLVRDETASQGTASRMLARFLIRSTVKNYQGGRPDSDIVSFREMYVRCVLAWNAWRRGQVTSLKYFPGSKIPSVY